MDAVSFSLEELIQMGLSVTGQENAPQESCLS